MSAGERCSPWSPSCMENFQDNRIYYVSSEGGRLFVRLFIKPGRFAALTEGSMIVMYDLI